MRLVAISRGARGPVMPLMRGGLRSMGFLQDLRKRLDEDTKVKEIKEAIKKDDGFDDDAFHKSAAGMDFGKDQVELVTRANRTVQQDLDFFEKVMHPDALALIGNSKVRAADKIQTSREKLKGETQEESKKARERLEAERLAEKMAEKETEKYAEEARKKRVLEEKEAKKAAFIAEVMKRREVTPWQAWVESFRPAGYRLPAEAEVDRMWALRMEQRKEQNAKTLAHKEFIERMKELEPEAQREEEQTRIESERAAKLNAEFEKVTNPLYKPATADDPFPYAPESTALVAGPEQSGWAKLKDKFSFNIRSSSLYQRGLEFKEKLEDSENPLISKTMDTLGAAGDLKDKVVNKVTGESETAASLGRLKQAWPHFDTTSFWLQTIRYLPVMAKAFHTRDFKWIKENSVPQMYDILCHKADELCKCVAYPDKFFYPFILKKPRTAEIIACTIDDPLRPHMILRFALQKTAEKTFKTLDKVVSPKINLGPSKRPDDIPFDTSKNFSHIDMAKFKEIYDVGPDIKRPGHGLIDKPPPEEVRKLKKKGLKALLEKDQVPFRKVLEDVKVVKANYTLVLQYDPHLDKWLVFNFEQSTTDLAF